MKPGMGVGLEWAPRLGDGHASAHSQMDMQNGTISELDSNTFSVSRDFAHGPAFDTGILQVCIDPHIAEAG